MVLRPSITRDICKLLHSISFCTLYLATPDYSYSYPTATLLYKSTVLHTITSLHIPVTRTSDARTTGNPRRTQTPNSDSALIPSGPSVENRPEAVTHREDSAQFDRPPLPGTRSVPSGARCDWLVGIQGVS